MSIIESIIIGAIVGYIISKNPRYRCMIQQCRWISKKEWDEA